MKQRGFTLTELLIVTTISGIIAAIATPNFNRFIRTESLVSDTNALVSAFFLARTEAIKRNTRVTICASSDGVTCGDSAQWNHGYIVFTDGAAGVGGVLADGIVNGADTILHIERATGTTIVPRARTLPSNSADNLVSYVSFKGTRGAMRTLPDPITKQSIPLRGALKICDPELGVEAIRVLSIDPLGRASASARDAARRAADETIQYDGQSGVSCN